jgi:AraC-like DNA-binding protein
MKYQPAGAFFGQTRAVSETEHVILTHVEYTLRGPGVGWHYHEHAFFSLILGGSVADGTKRGSVDCGRGTLLYLPSQEPHCNRSSGARLESFFVELRTDWFEAVGQREDTLRSVRHIQDPRIGIAFQQVYREHVLQLPNFELVVDGLLTGIVAVLGREASSPRASNRLTRGIKDLLHSSTATLTLVDMARELNVHPVYLSRYFSRHFGCGFRDYLRLVRVETATSMMHDASRSLTDIAFASGFADQSHFVRCFKAVYGQTPSAYRRALG